jgi:hypothetical protein
MNGTSMATPFVTGVGLLMEDADPTLASDQVKEMLTSTAIDWGRAGMNLDPASRGPDIDYGAGRLDAYAALAAASGDDPALSTPRPMPAHALRQGSLGGTGASMEYTVDVASTAFPVAATLIDVPSNCVSGGSNPDFDLTLTAPDGTVVRSASSSQRQDELGYHPPTTGVYRLRVVSFRDCGEFFVDTSGGSVSMQGSASGPTPTPGPSPTTPTTTATPTPTAPNTVSTATLTNAAKANARRAATALKKSGLRRLLRNRAFVLRGIAPSAGRLELVVRTSYRHHQVIVAKLSRRVGSAGQPLLTVRLTAAGRKLFARSGTRRLSIRAAVVDSATGRRTLADYRVLVRR